jgi:hypothetical protein
MKKRRDGFVLALRLICLACVVALGLMTIVATGGDGGGGGGGGGITYTGITSQATIDDTNAVDLSVGPYQGCDTGMAFGTFGAVQTAEHNQIGASRVLKLAQTSAEAILQVDVNAPPGVVVSGAVVTESDTIPGDCGGNASYTIEVDDVTGEFSGTMNFNDYCSEGITLSGRTSFSGKFDVDTENFLRISLSLHTVSVTLDSDSFTTSGSISFNFQASPSTATIDIRIRDNSTGKVYWANDYTITIVEESGYVEVEMSGRYYDPDYGYVDFHTDTPFRIDDGDEWPSAGVLTVEGEGGTKAQLTALSSTTYRVDADTDGDGTYDWDSDVRNWS